MAKILSSPFTIVLFLVSSWRINNIFLTVGHQPLDFISVVLSWHTQSCWVACILFAVKLLVFFQTPPRPLTMLLRVNPLSPCCYYSQMWILIVDKFCCFMRMSVRCHSFQWISDKMVTSCELVTKLHPF